MREFTRLIFLFCLFLAPQIGLCAESAWDKCAALFQMIGENRFGINFNRRGPSLPELLDSEQTNLSLRAFQSFGSQYEDQNGEVQALLYRLEAPHKRLIGYTIRGKEKIEYLASQYKENLKFVDVNSSVVIKNTLLLSNIGATALLPFTIYLASISHSYLVGLPVVSFGLLSWVIFGEPASLYNQVKVMAQNQKSLLSKKIQTSPDKPWQLSSQSFEMSRFYLDYLIANTVGDEILILEKEEQMLRMARVHQTATEAARYSPVVLVTDKKFEQIKLIKLKIDELLYYDKNLNDLVYAVIITE